MRTLRIYVTSIAAGLAGAIAVVWISSLMERHAAEQHMERLRHTRLPPDSGGMVM